jgi:hypothetical protein
MSSACLLVQRSITEDDTRAALKMSSASASSLISAVHPESNAHMGLYYHLSARLSPDPEDDESAAAASTESTTNASDAMHATHRPETQEAVDKDKPEQSATS